MIPLPIDSALPELIARLGESRNAVLVAPPGAGKTTRVPPAILRAKLLSPEHPNLVMLQPRRVAARTVAERIADENGWALGREVGYHVRFDRKLTSATRLRVVTEGILTRQLLDDPFLEGIGAVLLDEFHERSLFTDVAIALLREVQQTVRPDLILLVMSATLSAEPVARYLGDCPIVRAQGRTFPVEISYEPDNATLPQRVATAVDRAADHPDAGDVLAFLPGAEEIHRAQSALSHRADLLVLPLYGALSSTEQNLALRPAKKQKVILATNIAETSLTIDGVRTVIDSGFARVASFDVDRGMDRLDLQRISAASATQRAGRAGRTAPGRCIRLWPANEKLEPFDLPEIRRVDLAGTVLSLHAWGKPHVREFGWYESPDEESIRAAEELLTMLGALSTDGSITPLGRQLSNIPAHPRLGRLLVAAANEDLLNQGAALAALMAEKDILTREGPGAVSSDSDLVYRLELLDQAERAKFGAYLFDQGIDPAAARQVCKTRDELLRIGESLVKSERLLLRDSDRADSKINPSGSRSRKRPEEMLLQLPLNAYPDRVCKRREIDPMAAVMVGGNGVRLARESTLKQGDFFLAIDTRHDRRSATRESLVRIASRVDVAWLTELFPASIRKETGVEFDPQRQRVFGYQRTFYRDLLLSDDRNAAIDPVKAADALATALRPKAADLFAADESAAYLLMRIALLRQHMPEHPWPDVSDAMLGDLLAEQCAGKRSVEEVTRGGLSQFIRNHLHYPLDRLLEEHAPESIEVPTGNRIKLEYLANQPPVLAVRLQELFGWIETPTIANGRVRVRMHLLGPNYRPVQVTDDLKNFWATTYFQVRKDLRARYPKHSWPEEPLTAKPVARGRATRR